jgi:hypothetical protein
MMRAPRGVVLVATAFALCAQRHVLVSVACSTARSTVGVQECIAGTTCAHEPPQSVALLCVAAPTALVSQLQRQRRECTPMHTIVVALRGTDLGAGHADVRRWHLLSFVVRIRACAGSPRPRCRRSRRPRCRRTHSRRQRCQGCRTRCSRKRHRMTACRHSCPRRHTPSSPRPRPHGCRRERCTSRRERRSRATLNQTRRPV